MSELAQKSGKLRKIALRRRHGADPETELLENQGIVMPPLTVGCPVRVYYDEETFDEGEVKSISDTNIVHVDFYDWIECWTSPTQFALHQLYFEHKAVWIPTELGEVIVDFRLTNGTKPL